MKRISDEEIKDIVNAVDMQDHTYTVSVIGVYCSSVADAQLSSDKKELEQMVEWIEVHRAKRTNGSDGIDARTSQPCLIMKESDWQAFRDKWLK